MSADLTLDALEQALWARTVKGNLAHHSDRGSHYLGIRYTERLAEMGIAASVGSAGDAYDNAVAKTINGLHKATVIWKQGPWRSREAAEHATAHLGSLVQHEAAARADRLPPPAEFEKSYYDARELLPIAAGHT